MNQKILNGELSEFFFQCFDLVLFRGAFCKFSCYGSNIVFRRTVSGLFGRKNNALRIAIESLLPKDFLPRKDVERFKQDQFFFIHEDIEIHACFFLLPFVSFLERLECQPVFRIGIAYRAIIVPNSFNVWVILQLL